MKSLFGFLNFGKKQPEKNTPVFSSEETSVPENEELNTAPVDKSFLPNNQILEESKEKYLNFEKAAKYLAVRIYPQDYLSHIQLEEFVCRTDFEGTITMLVLDLPYSVENLLKATVERWQRETEELFEIAIQNVKEKYKREVISYEHTADPNLLTLSGNGPFITSEVFNLSNYPQLSGDCGAIFVMADRDHFICKPIHDDLSLEIGLEVLIPYANEICEKSEHPISRNIFWYYNGKIELIFSNIGIQRINYVLPFELEDMVY